MDDFIALSKNSKEIYNIAYSLKERVKINALIKGQVGVGKKTLAHYILPKVKIYDAKGLQEDIKNNLMNIKNSSIIIDKIEDITNIDLLIFWINKNNIRIIATTLSKKLNKNLENLFPIIFEILPLNERREDLDFLIKKFSLEASKTFKTEEILSSELIINISNNAHSLKKSIYFSYLCSNIKKDEIMMFMENFLALDINSKHLYKDLLYLLEIPLLKVTSRKYKSQVKMAEALGLTRITLRKKLNLYKI